MEIVRTKRHFRYKTKFDRIARKVCTLFGATNFELGKLFQVSKAVIEKWQYRKPSFKKACQDGRDAYDTAKVEMSLKKLALGYEYEEVSMTKKDQLDKEGNVHTLETISKTNKIIPPSATACIFWLVNRSRTSGRWMNIQNVQLTGTEGGPVKMEVSSDMSTDEATQIYMNLVKQVTDDVKKGKRRQ